MDKKELKSEELQDRKLREQEGGDEGEWERLERHLRGGPENIPEISVLQQEILKNLKSKWPFIF